MSYFGWKKSLEPSASCEPQKKEADAEAPLASGPIDGILWKTERLWAPFDNSGHVGGCGVQRDGPALGGACFQCSVSRGRSALEWDTCQMGG